MISIGGAQAAAPYGHPVKQQPESLTHVAAVHQLTPAEGAEGRPVHLRGVVTAVSGWKNSFFLQDSSGGVSVDSEQPTGAKFGDEVELDGYTGAGMFAPVVLCRQARILGAGVLPAARLFTYGELMSGFEDSQWIAVRGVVRAAKVRKLWTSYVLEVMIEASGGPVKALIREYGPGDADTLIDAEVHVKGVSSTSFNAKRQFTGLGLFVPDMKQVTIVEKAPADPYSIAVSPVRSVLQFKPGARVVHRLKVAGWVTYQDPGHSLYLQNGADGILLNTDQDTTVPIGTKIEAIGFPDPGNYSPVLRNARFRIAGPVRRIQPLSIRANDLVQTTDSFSYAPFDTQLVHLEGELIEAMPRLHDEVWLLRSGATHLSVSLRVAPGADPPEIQKGSILSVTGVLVMQVDEGREPVSFGILLRTPGDIVVLRKASWWTPQHALLVLALVLLSSAGIVSWGITLRIRVRQQTQMLRESETRFREQAQRDMLTGLASRSFLYEQLSAAIMAAAGRKSRMGILMVDLDHFKEVNDTLGHHAGDQLLRTVGERIRASVRKTDTVARMGGDEFVVLLTDIDDEREAELIGAKVVANVSMPVLIDTIPILVSASVGVCLYPEGGSDGDALLQNVDAAMYRAKAGGRNGYTVFSA